MKSRNSSFNQDNHEYERCAQEQRKMHKLCIKFNERELKNLNSKDFEKSKSMQTICKFEFKLT